MDPRPHLLTVEWIFPYPPYPMARHRHDVHELIYVSEGRYRVRTGAAQLEGDQGSVFYYPPHLEHQPNHDLDGLTLGLIQWRQVGEAPPHPGPRLMEDSSGRILSLLHWMMELSPAADEETEAILDTLLEALLYEHRTAGREMPAGPVRRALSHMRARMQDPLTLDELAGIACVSKYHLVRLFRRATGTTPMQRLRQIRAEAAVGLLTTTDLPLKSIARRVGIANEHYLSRVIHEVTGKRPRAFRAE